MGNRTPIRPPPIKEARNDVLVRFPSGKPSLSASPADFLSDAGRTRERSAHPAARAGCQGPGIRAPRAGSEGILRSRSPARAKPFAVLFPAAGHRGLALPRHGELG